MSRAQQVDAQLEELYAQVPQINCKGLCTDACGPIDGGHREKVRMARAGVKLPPVDVAIRKMASTAENYECPALKNGRCSVYEARPMVCFLPDTYVFTAKGPRRIAEVLAGDLVYGDDGRLHPVVGTASRWYEGPISGVRFSGTHVPVWCTSDHQWLSTYQKDKRKRPHPQWKAAQDLVGKRHHQAGDYLCFPTSFEDVVDLEEFDAFEFVSGQLSPNGERLLPFTTGKKSSGGSNSIPRAFAVDHEFLFMLGIYLAEGSASIQTASFTMNLSEEPILARVARYLTSIGVDTKLDARPSRNTLVLRADSALFARLMKSLAGVLAPDKAINESLFARLSHGQKWKVFEAWNIGDGRKSTAASEISVTTVSLKLALQMSFAALAYGYFPRLYSAKRSGRGTTCYDVHLFPSNWRGPKANHGTRNMADERFTYTPIIDPDVRPYAGPVIDIQVDGAESFVTSSGVAHNCRIWGASEDLPCPYGCAPPDGRLLSSAESQALLDAARKAGTCETPLTVEQAEKRLADPRVAKAYRSHIPRPVATRAVPEGGTP